MANENNTNSNIAHAVIAVNRFGLGAKPNELMAVGTNAKAWLKNGLIAINFNDDLPHSADVLKSVYAYRQMKKDEQKPQNNKSKNPADNAMMNSMASLKKYPREMLRAFSVSYIKQAVQSDTSISWRLLDFFSNHFSVSASGQEMAGLAATLEREAIGPNLMAKFEDMLLTVTQHPAMLIYLNNERSIGPNSKVGKKRGKGMNENLAREILELHTLGVNGGYQQADVIELAKGITGWGLSNIKKDKSAGFKYNSYNHEPGERVLLNKHYRQKGIAQGEAMLRDLANHPATIKHLCFKLARHFINDDPPASLVGKLVASWQQSSGNIKTVMTTMIEAQESWQPEKAKFKTPREFIISTIRALNIEKIKPKHLYYSFLTLGQQPFNAGSPAGYGDVAQDWNGANALMSRINWANSLANMAKVNAEQVIKNSFAQTLDKHHYKIISRAESRKQALTLLLMSPEFQRR
ncbi:MAG: DUF1800 domain-containing protein [Thalassotalea sp.]